MAHNNRADLEIRHPVEHYGEQFGSSGGDRQGGLEA